MDLITGVMKTISVAFKLKRDEYLKPALLNSEGSAVCELEGADLVYRRMNVRFAYFFRQRLSAFALRESLSQVGHRIRQQTPTGPTLTAHSSHVTPMHHDHANWCTRLAVDSCESRAQVLSGFPLLCGRERRVGRRHFVDLNGVGPLVREQTATVTGVNDLDDASLHAHIGGWVGCVCVARASKAAALVSIGVAWWRYSDRPSLALTLIPDAFARSAAASRGAGRWGG